MHPLIKQRVDCKRGCGWRKPGGLYLVADGPSAPCGKLPIPLDVCPTCHGGIKPSRGWTWINGTALLGDKSCFGLECSLAIEERNTPRCPLSKPPGRVGLVWIGEKFYATPADWTSEAMLQGVSRRIAAVPKEVEVGKTWIWVAHRKAIHNPDDTWTPGVFHAFRLQRIEYVVMGTETDEEIEALAKRGITPVQVQRFEEQTVFDRVESAAEGV